MERLTNADHKEMDLYAYCGEKNPYEIPLTIGELAGFPKEKYSPREILEEVFARLAAYEDTGLEPEEVLDLLSMREITPETEYAINKHADSLIERMDALIHKDDEELEKYREIGDLAHLHAIAKAEKDGRLVVLDEEMALAMYAGARSILNNKRLQGATYVYDCFGELDGPKEISYFRAAKVLRRIGNPALTRQEAEEAVREEADNG